MALTPPAQPEQGTKPALSQASASNYRSAKGLETFLHCTLSMRACALTCVYSLTEAFRALGEKGQGVVVAAAQTAGGLLSITTDVFMLCPLKLRFVVFMFNSFISVILFLSFHVALVQPEIFPARSSRPQNSSV